MLCCRSCDVKVGSLQHNRQTDISKTSHILLQSIAYEAPQLSGHSASTQCNDKACCCSWDVEQCMEVASRRECQLRRVAGNTV